MQHFNTLRVRFALWVAGLVLLALLGFGTFLYFSLAQGLSNAMDGSLRLSATQAITAVNIENGQINFSDSIPEPSAAADLRERGLTMRVLDLSGQTLNAFGNFRNLPIPRETLDAALKNQALMMTLTDATTQVPVRLYSVPIPENGRILGIIQVAQSLESVQDTLAQLLRALLVGGGALTLFAAAGGYFLAARALQPIDHMTQTARRISAQHLSARLNLPATDDEVGRLAATLDSMLERLDDSFRRERQFAADASHDLRTPLAALQAILEVTRAQPRSAQEYVQALDDISAEADRLASLTQNLLHLAHGDAPPTELHEAVNLSTLLMDVCDSLTPLAEAKHLTLTRDVAPELVLNGASDSLIRLFVNLLDNAIKYTEHGGIQLTARLQGNTIRVWIIDTGSGISPTHLPHIFDRFYRTDESRSTPGTGLGLAIAQEIAHAHGGAIEAERNAGGGSTFTVLLARD